MLDPGLGFFLGSNPEPSIVVLAAIRRLKNRYRLPVLISASRKSFLRSLTGAASPKWVPHLAAELLLP